MTKPTPKKTGKKEPYSVVWCYTCKTSVRYEGHEHDDWVRNIGPFKKECEHLCHQFGEPCCNGCFKPQEKACYFCEGKGYVRPLTEQFAHRQCSYCNGTGVEPTPPQDGSAAGGDGNNDPFYKGWGWTGAGGNKPTPPQQEKPATCSCHCHNREGCGYRQANEYRVARKLSVLKDPCPKECTHCQPQENRQPTCEHWYNKDKCRGHAPSSSWEAVVESFDPNPKYDKKKRINYVQVGDVKYVPETFISETLAKEKAKSKREVIAKVEFIFDDSLNEETLRSQWEELKKDLL